VTERPFKTIRLKKKPAGPAQTFPSDIRTVHAASAFVASLDPKTRAKLHWRLAASALAALDTGPIREGAYDRANKAMRQALAAERWLVDSCKDGWVEQAKRSCLRCHHSSIPVA
jgi:hypothetical protein